MADKKIKKMAEGGEMPAPTPGPTPTPEGEIVPPEAQAPAPQPAPVSTQTPPVPAAEEEAVADQTGEPAEVPPSPEGEAQPAATKPAADPNVQQASMDQDPARMQEHIAFASDLANGHIPPKTYSQFFENRSTLGRIGTLFGLMLSGAGSGLSHQPNMVMEMMNKEIDRDLERQKFNTENKRHLYALQMQHNLQQAQIANYQQDVTGKQIDAMAKMAGTAQYLRGVNSPAADKFENNMMHQMEMTNAMFEEAARAPFETKAKALLVTGQFLEDSTRNNPQANAIVKNVVHPAIVQKTQQVLQDGAAAAQAARQKAEEKNPLIPVNHTRLSDAIRLGQATPPGLPMPKGAINPHDLPEITKEEEALTRNRNAFKAYRDSFIKLSTMKNAGEHPYITKALAGAGAAGAGVLGSLIPVLGPMFGATSGVTAGGAVGHSVGKILQSDWEREREIQKNNLLGILKQSNMSQQEIDDFLQASLPSWRDSSQSMNEAFRKGALHFEGLEATPVLDRYNNEIPGLKKPFPHLELPTAKKSDKAKKK